MLTETFGELLFVPISGSMIEFPSPESLMRKIIISTKPPQEYKEFLQAKNNQNTNGNIDELADEGNLRRFDSNADESDGKVCNIIVF